MIAFEYKQHAAAQSIVSCVCIVLGSRRLLSSPASTGAPAPGAAAGGGQKSQSQLHRGKKEEGEERRLWPYLKAAKQQFFNVVVATLSIVMAVKMVEGKVCIRPHGSLGSFTVTNTTVQTKKNSAKCSNALPWYILRR